MVTHPDINPVQQGLTSANRREPEFPFGDSGTALNFSKFSLSMHKILAYIKTNIKHLMIYPEYNLFSKMVAFESKKTNLSTFVINKVLKVLVL